MAYAKRWPAGFNDSGLAGGTPADSAFLNAVEAALLALFDANPGSAGMVPVWTPAGTHYVPQLISNASIDPAAAIAKSKLAALNITDADVAGAANIAQSKINGLAASIAAVAVPPGTLVMFAAAAAPTGYLLCDGSSVLRATYPDLFTAIGTVYGSVDGTHFTLPDMRGRVPVGLGTHADVSALANTDGSALANRRPKHKHTVNEVAHSHTTPFTTVGGSSPVPHVGDFGSSVQANVTGSAVSTGLTVGPQTGAEPTDAAAYLVVNYIIKT